MCGRLSCGLCKEELIEACSYSVLHDKKEIDRVRPLYIDSVVRPYEPSYNICPNDTVLILTKNCSLFSDVADNTADFIITPMRFGMVTNWTTSRKLCTHNVRIETAMESQLYRPQLMLGRRCVVLCDGFYEWQRTKHMNQPFYLYPEIKPDVDDGKCKQWLGKPLLKLAGIFRQDTNMGYGEPTRSCSIITTESSQTWGWLHDRMPIVLNTYDDVNKWVNNKSYDCQQSWNFVTNFESKNPKYTLKHYPVDTKYVNNLNEKSSKCKQPLKIKRQATLDLFFMSKRRRSRSPTST